MVNKMALMGKGLNNPQSDIKKKKKNCSFTPVSGKVGPVSVAFAHRLGLYETRT